MPRPLRVENPSWPRSGDSRLHATNDGDCCVQSVFEGYHQDLRHLLDEKLGEVLAHSLRIERSLEELRGAQRTRRSASVEHALFAKGRSRSLVADVEDFKSGKVHGFGHDSRHDLSERQFLEQRHTQFKKGFTLQHMEMPLHEREQCIARKFASGGSLADRPRSENSSYPGDTPAATLAVVKHCSEGDEPPGSLEIPDEDATNKVPSDETFRKPPARATTHPMAHWLGKSSTRNTTAVGSRVQSLMQSRGAGWANRITSMLLYKRFVPTSIVLNAVFIGVTVQWQAKTGEPAAFEEVVELIFSIIFAAELAVRLCAEGCSFFSNEDRSWNWFDFFIVSVGLAERLLMLLKGTSGLLSDVAVLRIVRVVRIMRVLRIIRTLKFFRDLRIMVQCILASIKSLTWVLCVLAMMFYVFGVALTQGANDLFSDIHSPETPPSELANYFGSLDRSMLSLFQAMAGGINWGELVKALRPLPYYYTAIFIMFIALAIYAVANVVTGVFVENAVQSGQNDRDSLVEEELRAKKKYAKLALQFFQELDVDGSGSVSYDELELACADESVVAYFGALQLDISDVRTLFSLMDPDRSGEISIEEFITGLLRLKGEARSIDIAKLQYEVEQIVLQINGMTDMLKPLLTSLPKSASRSNGVSDPEVGFPRIWQRDEFPNAPAAKSSHCAEHA